MCLGVIISRDYGCYDEIEQRIGAAARVVGALREDVLERREFQKKSKMKVFNAMVDVKRGQCRGGMKASRKL